MNGARRQHGFSFVEIMIAVLLLAICAVPMGQAIRNGISASAAGANKARELRCMKNTMETVLAEPFRTLLNAARNRDQASGYALPVDAACDGIARTITITWYELEAGKPEKWLDSSEVEARREDAMLRITVSSGEGGYAFTRLVTR